VQQAAERDAAEDDVLPFVRLRLSDGQTATLCPGDIVGRMATAALVLDDPRVSEAHALVSLRGAELQLLALRGRFAVDGEPVDKVTLALGQQIAFAEGLDGVVEAVQLPEQLAAIEGPGLPRQVLTGASSVLVGPPPRVVPGTHRDAAAWVWSSGSRWRARVGAGAAVDLLPGDSFVVGSRAFRLVWVKVERAGVDATVVAGRVGEPLELTAAWDTFRIDRAGQAPVLFGGQTARLLSVLVEVDAAISWEGLARELWPLEAEPEREALRRRLDVALYRLRQRLRACGVRTDLVRATGSGMVELVRYAGDVVRDRS
jgi:hypothetical protein